MRPPASAGAVRHAHPAHGAQPGRHEAAVTDPRDHQAVALQGFVGTDHGVTGHVQAVRQGAGRRQAGAGRQVTVEDRVAQRRVDTCRLAA